MITQATKITLTSRAFHNTQLGLFGAYLTDLLNYERFIPMNAGCEADFIVLNPQATPLLSRRIAAADSLQEQMFAMVVLGDDRLVERVVVNGTLI